MHARFRVACAAGIIAVLTLSGCAITPPSEVTDSESRDRFLALLDEAQRVAGGAWDEQDDPSTRECIVPLWVPGERIPGLRTGPAPRDGLEAAATRMEQHFDAEGLSTTVSELGDVVEVKAESIHGELVLFRVSETAMTLTGESECRPV